MKIPSISIKEENNADVRRAAEYVSKQLSKIGMKQVEIFETDLHPVVYGENLDAGKNAPTVLIYGHFDVQAPEPLGDWKTANGVYPDNVIQLAAYKQLWDENYPDQPITGGFHLCRFAKEHADFSHHYWSELDDAWEQFKLFLSAYEIDKRIKKRVK